MKGVDHQAIADFQKVVWEHFAVHARTMPWREKPYVDDPYAIMVSEVMLQQTQVSRVIPKFLAFMQRFPTIHKLAMVPLADVLRAWSGLGYNRRAKYLWEAAKAVDSMGDFPRSIPELMSLSGVGRNTAGAIAAYAYNQPAIYVETNIRSVFIYHFFPRTESVSDIDILKLVEQTLPDRRFRQWYWALMDYGAYLKKENLVKNSRSKHFVKQGAFHGSRRQLRGMVLRLLQASAKPIAELRDLIADDRFDSVLDDLGREGLITRRGDLVSLLE